MWTRLRRFSGFSRSAKVDFVRAALFLPLIRISLRLRGFRATQRSLQLRHEAVTPAGTAADQTEVCLVVQAAARYSPIAFTCLERALVLWRLLGRRGIPTNLRIGARKVGERFEAHAWVERNGAVVGEPDDTHRHYAAFEKEFSEDLR